MTTHSLEKVKAMVKAMDSTLYWANVIALFPVEHYGWAGPRTCGLWDSLRAVIGIEPRRKYGICEGPLLGIGSAEQFRLAVEVMRTIGCLCPFVLEKRTGPQAMSYTYLPYALERALEEANEYYDLRYGGR